MDIRRLGVYGESGQPVSGDAILPSPMNVVEAIGRFPRIFDTVIELNGETDRDYILGSGQQGKLSWYVLNDAIEKARPYKIRVLLKSFKGVSAVQASYTIQDSGTTPQNTLTLKDAYRNSDSYGLWGNDSGFRVDQGIILTTSISAPPSSAASGTISLQSVVGLKVGSILKITHSNIDYGFKVLSIDENLRNVSGIPDPLLPILSIGDTVQVLGFKITSVRRDFRGAVAKQNIGLNDSWLSMEPECEDYIQNVFASHPIFKAVDLLSTNQFWKKFPASTPDGQYIFLTSGSDGSSPSATIDWTSLQSYFPEGKTFAVLNCESTSKTVHQNFEAWCSNRKDHPVYIGPIQDFGNDPVSLANFGKDFLRRDGWVQIGLFYGWRYVADSFRDGSNPVMLIPVAGGVLGNWINVIYEGFVHRSPSESRFPMSGYVDGPFLRPEDTWDDSIRTSLYEAGINIVRKVEGSGILLRNFRSPSENYLVRDLHIHAINQLIKFTSELNLAKTESEPNQFSLLQKDALRIEHEVLKPLFDGNFAPFCLDSETGAFRNTDDNGNKLEWNDVSGVRADRFNNPPTQFAQGDADLWPEWVPYSLRRSLRIRVSTAVTIFSKRG